MNQSYKRIKKGVLLTFILLLPIVSVSQNLKNSLPKWIKFENIDAVVISIPQMDSISVKIMQRNWYKKKLESNKYRFDIMMLEIESLTYQNKSKAQTINDLKAINLEKDIQINTFKKELKVVKPSFFKRLENDILNYLIGAVLGAIAGLII